MALSKKMDCYDEMINAMAVANRCLGYVNAPSLFQLVVSRCLDEGVDLDFYDRNRKLLYDKLTSLGFKVVKPQGAFYLLVKAPMEDEEEFVSLAKIRFGQSSKSSLTSKKPPGKHHLSLNG